MKKFSFLLLASLLSLGGSGARGASTVNVTTTTDGLGTSPMTLRAAINIANNTNNLPVTILVPPGTYKLTLHELPLGPTVGSGSANNILIVGTGSSANTVITQSDGQSRVFDLDPNSIGHAAFAFANLTIMGGNDTFNDTFGLQGLGGGGILFGDTGAGGDVLRLTNCAFLNNQSSCDNDSDGGGAALGSSGGSVFMTGCVFSNNVLTPLSVNSTVGLEGAAVYFAGDDAGDTLTATGCVFQNNTVTGGNTNTARGGAVATDILNVAPAANLTNCVFGGNSVTSPDSAGGVNQGGGALYLYPGTGSSYNVIGCTFTNNQANGAVNDGGAINCGQASAVLIEFCRFAGNSVAAGGAGSQIFVETTATSFSANDNWWASDSGPTAAMLANATPAKWLFLTNTASSASLFLGGTSAITASFLKDSAGTAIAPSNLGVLTNLAVAFVSVDGTNSSAQSVIQTGDTAGDIFTGTTAGSGKVTATVDGVSSVADISVSAVSVTSVSSSPASAYYKAGQSVPITLAFDGVVNVTGTPQLALSSGGIASYASGSGTATLTFDYTVGASDTSPHLDYASTTALALNGGTMESDGFAVNLTLPTPGAAGSLSANTTIVIDTTPPAVAISAPSVASTNQAGSVSFTITYFDLNLSGATFAAANVTLTNPAVTGTISVVTNNSTNFTVNIANLAGVGAQAIQIAAGTATDLAGNSALAAGPSASFTVLPPTVTGISPASGPNTGGTGVTITGTGFAAGATVSFGPNAGTSVIVVNSTTITVTSPVGSGVEDVTVTAGSQTSAVSSADHFTYTAAASLVVSLPASATVGVAFSGTVTAVDQFSNTFTAYTGTVHFTSSDGAAVLPANATLINGTGTFSFTLNTLGGQTVAATDTVASSITGTSGTVMVSAAPDFVLYAGNAGNSTVSQISTGGVVSAFVTSGLSVPTGLAVDEAGNVYIASRNANAVLRATPSGVTSSFVTSGLNSPQGLALDSAGNLYVANGNNNTISKVTPAGVVSTFVSNANGLNIPTGLAFDLAGNLYVANQNANSIFKVTPGGVVSTFVAGTNGLDNPHGLAFDRAGNLYIVNISGAGTISKVTTNGVVSTFLGSGLSGTYGLAIDSADNLYVASDSNNTISKVTPGGVVSTFATGLSTPLYLALKPLATRLQVLLPGETNAPFTTSGKTGTPIPQPAGASFNVTVNAVDGNWTVVSNATPTVAFTSSDPAATLPANAALTNGSGTFSVTLNTPGGQTVTATDTAGSNPLTAGTSSSVTVEAPPTVAAVSPASGPAAGGTTVTITGGGFTGATNVAFGAVGTTNFTVVNDAQITVTAPPNIGTVDVKVTVGGQTSATSAADEFSYKAPNFDLYVANFASNTIARVATNGQVSTFVPASAGLNGPLGLAFDTSSNLFVASENGNSISEVSVGGTVSLFNAAATLGAPQGLAFDSVSNLYVAIQDNSTIAKITPGGLLSSFVSSGLSGPGGLVFDASGNLYIANSSGNTITKVAPGGARSTFVDTTHGLNGPIGLAFDGNGNLYIANFSGNTVSKVTTAGVVSTYLPSTNELNEPYGLAIDGAGNLYVANFGTTNILQVTQGGVVSVYATGLSKPSYLAIGPPSAAQLQVLLPGETSAPFTATGKTGTPIPQTAGTSFAVTVNAVDGNWTVVSGATPTVAFTSSDPAATLPANAALTNGSGTFSVTLNTAGSRTITATDTAAVNSLGFGTSSSVTVGAPPPTVTGISPASGPAAGGTGVTITGTGFASGATVSFGATAGTSVNVVNATTITAASPAGSGVVDVTVTTGGQTSATSPADQFTYVAAPTVTGISPTSGPTAGGTGVTITGTGFASGATVRFGATAGTSVNVVNATTITATSPAGSGAVDVTVTAGGQTSATSPADQFTYVVAPTVTGISPTSGPTAGGTAVTITGTGFVSGATVRFGATAGTSVNVVNATTITATSPAGSGVVDVTVTSGGQTSAVSSADQFTYVGKDFDLYAGNNDNTISAVSSNGVVSAFLSSAAGLDGPYGSAFDSSGNFYVANALNNTVSKITPDGVVSTFVASTSGLSFPYALAFDSAGNLYVGNESGHNISKVTPGGVVSTFATGLNSPDGLAFDSAGNLFVANLNNSTVSKVTPGGVVTSFVSSGLNTPIGLAFDGSGNLYVGNNGASSISKVTPGGVVSTFATGLTPVGLAFDYVGNLYAVNQNNNTIVKITPGGVVSTFTAALNSPTSLSVGPPLPSVTGVSPASGVSSGGTTVTITGTGFASGATVTFGTNAATGVTVNSATNITATSPAGIGTVDVTVTVGSRTSGTSAADQFAYAPIVTGVSPASGPAAGGTGVTITGTGFASGATVSFGATAGTSVNVVNATTITATSPAGSGVVDVTVTSGGQTSATSSADQFTYVAAPTVTGISPSSGPAAGGTGVTITGTGFASGATVSFGATAGTSVVVVNATTITATSPTGSGVVDATVTVGGQTSATSSADQYTYASAPYFLYVANNGGNTISGITADGTASPFVTSGLDGPTELAFDTSSNLYVANHGNNTISKITPGGAVSTFLSGNGLNGPYGLAFDGATNLYIANFGASNILKVTPGGTVSTFATGLNAPVGLVFDTSGNLYVANYFGNTISKITPGGVVSTFASGFSSPGGLVFDIAGNLYVANSQANTVLRVTPGGVVSTFVGNTNGFVNPIGLGMDTAGNLYVASLDGSMISKVTPGGVVSTFATNGLNFPLGIALFPPLTATRLQVLLPGETSAPGTVTGKSGTPVAQQAGTPFTVTVNAVDSNWDVILNVAPTVAFTSSDLAANLPSNAALTNGSGTFSAMLNTAGGQTITATDTATVNPLASGTSSSVTVGAPPPPTVTGISPASGPGAGGTAVTITGTGFAAGATVSFGAAAGIGVAVVNATTITAASPAGSGVVDVTVNTGGGTSATSAADQFSYTNAAFALYVADFGGNTIAEVTSSGMVATFATSSGFVQALGVAFDVSSNLYVADLVAGTVSKITPGRVVSTFATGFSQPAGLAFDSSGNLYVANFGGTTISKVTPGGAVSTFATGLSQPEGLVFDSAGNLYAANSQSTTVSKITPGGVVSTYASGLSNPSGLAMDGAGNLYVANAGDGAILKVAPGGSVSSFASGLGGLAGLTIDSAGNLYVPNSNINTISKVTPGGVVSIFATNNLSAPVLNEPFFLVVGPPLAARLQILLPGETGAPGTATGKTGTPAAQPAGTAFNVTVNAVDPGWNVVPGATPTVALTSSDGAATLPANAALVNGTGTFSVTLNTAGSQTITTTDTAASNPLTPGTSASVSVTAGAATHFAVSLPASATAGAAFSGTVTALDQFNNTVSGYAGTVRFTSSDGAAVLPAGTTLASGVGTFSFTLDTAGSQTVTATDTVTSSITGTSGSVAVSAGAATHLLVAGPATAVSDTQFRLSVTALDAFGNTVVTDQDAFTYSSTDPDHQFFSNFHLTNGVAVVPARLDTSGNQTVTVGDAVNPAVQGTSGQILITAGPAAFFVVTAPSSATAGAAFNFTVTAEDAFGNVVTSYAGTVHFTSTDGSAVLPANALLTSGTGTFAATLKTTGNQTMTATDTVTSSIMGTSGTVAVTAASATHFTLSAPGSATAGTAFNATVTAQDQFNNTATAYAGTVHFTSSDASAVLPANATLVNGVGTFSFTLKTAGNQTVTATDTLNAAITGASGNVAVTVVGVGVTAINRATASPTNLAAVSWTVAFNGSVSNLTSADFGLVNTGLAGTPAITVVSASGGAPSATWTVTASTGTGGGSLQLDLTNTAGVTPTITNLPFAGQSYVIDTVLPTVTISAPSVSITNGGSVSYTVTFSDTDLAGASLPALSLLANATGTAALTNIAVTPGTGTATSTNYLVTLSGVEGTGTLGITIPAGAAFDQAGNKSAARASATFEVDTTLPTVTISAPSVSVTNGGSVSYNVSFSDADLAGSSLPALSMLTNQTGSATISGIAVTPGAGTAMTTNYLVTLSGVAGTGTLGITIPAGAAFDQAGNESAAQASATFVVDSTLPTVTISAPSVSITNGGSVSYTVTLADSDLAGSSLPALSVLTNQTGSATITNIAVTPGPGSAATTNYTVTLSGLAGNGTLGITIPSGAAFDVAGNQSAARASGTFQVDTALPTVAIGAPSVAITNGGSVSYTVTFSDADLAGSSLPAFSVLTNQTGSATFTNLTVTPGAGTAVTTNYLVTLSGLAGNGTLGITIPAGAAFDEAGNRSAAAASGTFQVDTTLPTLTISAPSVSITNSGSVSYLVTFADADLAGASLAALSVLTNQTGTATITNLAVAPGPGTSTTTNYLVTLSGLAGNGTLGITIPAGAAVDQAGNGNAAQASLPVQVDATLPTVTFSAPSVAMTNGGSVSYTVTFSDPDLAATSLLASSVIALPTGSASVTNITVSPGPGTATSTNYLVTVFGVAGNGTVAITVPAGAASDTAGNQSAPATSPSFTVDTSLPLVAFSAPSVAVTNGGCVTYTVTFSDADLAGTSLAGSNLVAFVTGTAVATNIVVKPGPGTATSTNYLVSISHLTGNGTVAIAIAPGAAFDTAGNRSALAVSPSFTLDTILPTVTISGPSVAITNGGSVCYTVTFADGDLLGAFLPASNVGTIQSGSASITNIVVTPGTGTTNSTNYLVRLCGLTGNGTMAITIPTGVAFDTAGNQSPPTSGASFIIDTTPPSVTISAPSVAYTNGGSVSYTVTFADPYLAGSSLPPSNVGSIQTGSISFTNIVVIPGTGTATTTNYTVKLCGLAGNGTLAITIPTGAAFDTAGNLSAPFASASVTIDTTPVGVTISPPSAAFTNGGSVSYTVTFADADLAAVSLPASSVGTIITGSASFTNIAVTPGAGTATTTNYLVKLCGLAGNGTLAITIPTGAASDLAGNQSLPVASTSFTVDTILPTVTIGPPSVAITNGGSVTYTVTLADADLAGTPLLASSVGTIITGSASATNIVVLPGTGTATTTNYTVKLCGFTGNGTLAITLPTGAASDLAGNQSAPVAGGSFIIDTTPPTVTISGPSTPTTANGPVTYTVSYADTNFGSSSLVADNVVLIESGTVSASVVVSGGGAFYTVALFGISGVGSLTIALPPGTAVDLAGNLAPAAGPAVAVNVVGWGSGPLYSFTNGMDGAVPQSAVFQGQDGIFYGTAEDGGTNHTGVFYRITTNGVFAPLYYFGAVGTNGTNADGANPEGTPIQGVDGDFYGTTYAGGANATGTVFRVTSTGVLTSLYSFAGGPDGSRPVAGLLQTADGLLHGVTIGGGTNGSGAIFQITTNGGFTPVYSFGALDPEGFNGEGAAPHSQLVLAADGGLYGTAPAGGTNGWGTVFRLASGGVFSVVYTFSGGADGAIPVGSLAAASDGNLYGTTLGGGMFGQGTVFRLSTNGALSTLHSFGGTTDGANPFAGLLQASDGGLYGTTRQGGPANGGTVFRLGLDGSFSTIYSFGAAGGSANPQGNLVEAGNGNLYGTSVAGGTAGWGTVFEMFNPSSSPLITPQPADQAGMEGGSASFTVGALGPAPLNYQWFFNGVALAGATNATLSLTGLDHSQAGFYTAVVGNLVGAVTSAPAQLYFFELTSAPTLADQSAVLTIWAASGTQFRLDESGDLSNPTGWTTLAGITVTTSPVTFTDPNATYPAARFYRLTPTN